MALPKDHWIHNAVNNPGELHRRLGIPKGEKIPTKLILQAARSSDPKLRDEAQFAENVKKK